ncbi:MAG: tetratricopeptide repeat protein [Deltaproteobacteria bacterium]|nr:tetratricopeptide repeat protein [Deltaproteobacteria bacterium]
MHAFYAVTLALQISFGHGDHSGGPEPTIPPPLPADEAERGRFLLERGAVSQAIALSAAPKDPHAMLVRGMARARKQKFVEAEADFAAAIAAIAARDRTGCAVDARVFGCGGAENGGATRGRSSECRCDAGFWESLAAEAAYERAYAEFDAGDLKKAEASLRALTEKRPRHADAHALAAEIAVKRGDFDFALASARNAVGAKGDHKWATHLVGQILFKQKKFVEAAAAYQRHIEIDPECHEGRIELARSLRETGRLKDAEREYASSLCYHLDDADAHFGAGESALAEGRLVPAIYHLKRAAEIRPNLKPAVDLLARAEAAVGDRYAFVWKYFVSWIPAAVIALASAIVLIRLRRRIANRP